jgi:hypothetical protein
VQDPQEDDIFHELYRVLMSPDPENFPQTVLQGLQRVCSMKYAFMSIPESAMPLLGQMNCTFVPLPYKTYPISLAIAFSPSTPYRDFWNYRRVYCTNTVASNKNFPFHARNVPYEDGCLLVYSAVESGKSCFTFRSYLLPPSSERCDFGKYVI